MATKEMSIKLMIDPESNRLIFGEASKDFVDFLIYLLSLPIATATNLLSDGSMVGSIGNIYASVSNLDETYLRPNVNKSVILSPMFFPSAIKTPLSPAGSSINSSRKFYTCFDPKCKRFITNIPSGARCSYCSKDMNNEIKFIDHNSDGFVQSAASYMISDDLSIASISTMSIVSMLNKFNVTKPEERVVKIGNEEALKLLKASLQSTTALTDVFLNTKKRKQPGGPIYTEKHDAIQKQNQHATRVSMVTESVTETVTLNHGVIMKEGNSKEKADTKLALKKTAAGKKPAKYPNKPKRPVTAFFVFMEDFRKTYKEYHPNNKFVSAVAKAGGEKWKAMSEAEKAPYKTKADNMKVEYEKTLKAYNKKLANEPGAEEESNNNDDDNDVKNEEEDDGDLICLGSSPTGR